MPKQYVAKAGVASSKAPLSDADRHRRFVETAKEIDADEAPAAFDRAFASVVTPPKPKG